MTNAKELLTTLTNDVLDEDILNYLAEMLEHDRSQLNPEMVHDYVSPFLQSETGFDEEKIMAICTRLFNDLASHSNDKEPTPSIQALDETVTLDALTDPSANRFFDPFLGITGGKEANYNSSIPISEQLKLNREKQKDREASLRRMREWEKMKRPIPSPKRFHGDETIAKMTDIIIEKFSLSVSSRELLDDAQLKLCLGRRYGLIGRNGIGKSSLLGSISRKEVLGIKSNITVGCVEQEIVWSEQPCIDAVLEVDVERHSLLTEQKELESMDSNNVKKSDEHNDMKDSKKRGERLAYIYDRLERIGAHEAEAEAALILAGLGLNEQKQHMIVTQLSGGWRMRVALARALFANPDILLLDEPTNHLDIEAVTWLTTYLQSYPKTVICVSHARGFLNAVCTDIIHFDKKRLNYYRGNYDTFEETKYEKEKQQQKEFDSQEAKKKHIQQFVDRFRCNAKRASLVQSRIKALNKMPMLDAVSKDVNLAFTFKKPEPLQAPIIETKNVYFKYPSSTSYTLRDVCLSLSLDSRIAICGVNGCGKSTLLHLLVGDLEPTKGDVIKHGRLRIGYFTQHHVDSLDLTLSATQQLMANAPELKEQEARNYLGSFGIYNLLALEPLFVLSGGQKSRVAIALMAYSNPHLLILDEPTNHLDLEAVQSLISALCTYEGGVVLVSHDIHLLSCVVDEVYHINPATQLCEYFKGDMEDYRKEILGKTKKNLSEKK